MLIKRPGFTAVALITLALGVGATTAIFSVVNGVLLRSLPYEDAERLVWIWETSPKDGIKAESTSLPNYTDWKSQNQSFESMSAFANTNRILSGVGEPERVPCAFVTNDFFTVLKVEPVLGRVFTPEENTPGKHRVLILSHGLWQRRFAGSRDVLDSSVLINSEPYTIVGVMPADFRHPNPSDRNLPQFWMPLGRDPAQAGRRSDFLNTIARMKPGVTLEQAQADMTAIASRLEADYPNANTGFQTEVLSMHERFIGDVKTAIWVLFVAVCFLLLIGCANVANLMLARAASRQKEMAIRIALGAGRRRIIQQLLTESLILASVGGAIGVLLAMWGLEALISISPPNIPRVSHINLDPRVLVFALGVSIVTGMIFGLLPALQASSVQLSDSLKEGGRSSGEGTRSGRVRNALVMAEVALALMLLVGAGLMVRSFSRLQAVNPGFDPERVLAVEVLLPPVKYKAPEQVSFFRNLLDRIKQTPGIESAGAIDTLPLAGGGNVLSFSIEGRQIQLTDRTPDAEVRAISLDYFRTMNIPLVAGRPFTEQDVLDFNEQDAAKASNRVAIINETLARQYYPGEDPIANALNQRINLGNPNNSPWRTIVGIVADTHHEGLNADPYAQMYLPLAQNPRTVMTIVARTTSDPTAMIASIRGQVAEMDKDLPLHNIRTMGQVVSESIARPRFNMTLIAVFAIVAMTLAAVGIYGVISYSVTQRTHEIGVRMALGARPGDVLKMVLRQGMAMTLAGVAIGIAGAFALTRLMESLLFGVTATDIMTFAAVSLMLVGVALVACFVPARRATKVDPMVALRYE